MNGFLRGIVRGISRYRVLRHARRSGFARHESEIGGNRVTTVGPFARPFDIAVDASGRVYVAEFSAHCIIRLAPDLSFDGWLGGGTAGWQTARRAVRPGAGEYAFRRPHSVYIDAGGRLLVADLDNRRIQVYSATGVYERTIGGGYLKGPASARVADGDILICDAIENCVMRVDAGDKRMGIVAGFNQPHSALVGADGILIVADTWNHRIVRVTPDGTIVGLIGRQGPSRETGALDAPVTVAPDGSGGIIVAEYGNHRIQRFTADGRPFGWIGAANDGTTTAQWRVDDYSSAGDGIGAFRHPYSATFRDGALYVADTENNRIQVIQLAPQ